jgi:hypothetical protein
VGGLGVQPNGQAYRTSVKVPEIALFFLLLAEHFPAVKNGELTRAKPQSSVLEADAEACKRDEAGCNTRVSGGAGAGFEKGT